MSLATPPHSGRRTDSDCMILKLLTYGLILIDSIWPNSPFFTILTTETAPSPAIPPPEQWASPTARLLHLPLSGFALELPVKLAICATPVAADRMALGQKPSARIDGQAGRRSPPRPFQQAVVLARLAESHSFNSHELGNSKTVVYLGKVDFLRSYR